MQPEIFSLSADSRSNLSWLGFISSGECAYSKQPFDFVPTNATHLYNFAGRPSLDFTSVIRMCLSILASLINNLKSPKLKKRKITK